MLRTLRHAIEICLEPPHLRRTTAIALIVGAWLTLLNQGALLMPSLLRGDVPHAVGKLMLIQIFLNFLTPFLVSNWGLVARQSSGQYTSTTSGE